MEFAEGDVVQLKSGGQAMTVYFVGDKTFPSGQKVPVVGCKWFAGKELKTESFKPALLKKVD